MKLDAHQHFWRYDPAGYAWIGETMSGLKRDFLPATLAPLLKTAGLDGSIAVQARQTPEETRWLLELAARHGCIKGVVGWVDLCSSDVERQLAACCVNPTLCGVRHVVQDEPDDRFLLRDDFRRGIAALAPHALAYDLLLFPKHLPAACALVEQFPDQTFVLDHLAKPLIKDAVLEPWNTDVRHLAAFPNVSCKVSGMVTEADWQRWSPEDFRPYLDAVFEAFGVERLMFGSDWPVCTLAASYERTLAIPFDYLRQFSAADRAAVLGGNARRIYRITSET